MDPPMPSLGAWTPKMGLFSQGAAHPWTRQCLLLALGRQKWGYFPRVLRTLDLPTPSLGAWTPKMGLFSQGAAHPGPATAFSWRLDAKNGVIFPGRCAPWTCHCLL